MSHTAEEVLHQLEDRFISGELLQSDYDQLKWKVIKELRDRGEPVPTPGRMVQRAELVDSRGESFCYIPTAPFFFGPNNEYCELPAPIYMAQNPVTAVQFQVFLQESGHPYSQEDWDQLDMVCPDPSCPVSHVSWDDAKAYCRWLRRITGEYYSLPNENEWEMAARGIDGRYYPWGDDPLQPDFACYESPDMAHSSTVEIGQSPRNRSPYGCIDMVGNVWEWCVDSFEDPRDPHILRGGGWCNSWEYCNCLSRTFSYPPDQRIDFGGFRIIYLPQDMLADYQTAYQGGDGASQRSLQVVRFSQKSGPAASPAAAGRRPGSLSTKLGAALQRAATTRADGTATNLAAAIDQAMSEPTAEEHHEQEYEGAGAGVETFHEEPAPAGGEPPGGMSIQERMLWEISNASKKYISEKEQRGEAVERHRPLQKLRTETEKSARPKSGVVDFQVGAIDELKEEVDEYGDPILPSAAALAARADSEADAVHDLLAHEAAAERYEPPGATGATYAAFGLWVVLAAAAAVVFYLKLGS